MRYDRRRTWLRAHALMLSVAIVSAAHAQSPGDARAEIEHDPDALIGQAAATLSAFIQDPAMESFRQSVAGARGLLVVPDYVKIGLWAAGASGKGVLIARGQSDAWTGPVFYELNTTSLGLQVGFERSQMTLLVRNQRGLDTLLVSSVKIGGKVSAAAGPVGAGAISEREDIVYFIRKSRGGFVGMSLDSTVIEPDQALTDRYYGRAATPMDVLVRGTVTAPKPNPLIDALR